MGGWILDPVGTLKSRRPQSGSISTFRVPRSNHTTDMKTTDSVISRYLDEITLYGIVSRVIEWWSYGLPLLVSESRSSRDENRYEILAYYINRPT